MKLSFLSELLHNRMCRADTPKGQKNDDLLCERLKNGKFGENKRQVDFENLEFYSAYAK